MKPTLLYFAVYGRTGIANTADHCSLIPVIMFHPPKASRLPYYPTDPGPLYCWLCGLTLESITWQKDRIPGFAFQNELWYEAWQKYRVIPMSRRRKFSLYMNVSDLAVSFENRFQWPTLFRTIVWSAGDKGLPEGYHLSGIGYMPGARNGQYLLACRDPATACLGAARENSDTLRVSPVQHLFSYGVSGGGHLKGYPVHSRCWDLIEHKFGPLATLRLDLIATALRKQWYDIIPRISHPQLPTSLRYNFRQYQGVEDNDQVEDPMFIPKLDTLLQDCTNLPANDSQEIVSLDILSSKYNIPLEITYLIADRLNLRDTYNMLAAFGGKFPVDYWKRHIPSTDIIFELKKFDSDSFLWPYISVEIESRGVMETYGIWNRKRILAMLNLINQLVNTELNNEQNNGKQQELSYKENLI